MVLHVGVDGVADIVVLKKNAENAVRTRCREGPQNLFLSMNI